METPKEITEEEFYKMLDIAEKNKPEPVEEPDEEIDPWLLEPEEEEEFEKVELSVELGESPNSSGN
jgi:hypothetical protein